jgi:site-specific DNA-methyltransferase (adenine-specific)
MPPYYERNGIQLFHGDCLDVMGKMSEKVDSVITDPPFEPWAHEKQTNFRKGALDFESITEELRTYSAKEFARLAKRWCLVFCQVEASVKWTEVLTEAGMAYRRTCIWVKPDGMPQFTGDRPGMGYEAFVACHALGASTWNGGGRSGVFTHVKHVPEHEKTGHRTQKPVALMSELVKLFTDPGETILDAFAGSGSTLVAAYRLERKAIGIELDESYCEAIAKRLEREMSQLRMFETNPPQGATNGSQDHQSNSGDGAAMVVESAG